MTVALPYFVLSATGPLVQAWFSGSFPGRSPYRLYSLSNAGSLLALLTYPVLIEPTLKLSGQAVCWEVGFLGVRNSLRPAGMAVRSAGESHAEPAPIPRDDENPYHVHRSHPPVLRPNPRPSPRCWCPKNPAATPCMPPIRTSFAVADRRLAAAAGVRLADAAGHDEPCLPGRGRDPVSLGCAAGDLFAVVHRLLRPSAVVLAALVSAWPRS